MEIKVKDKKFITVTFDNHDFYSHVYDVAHGYLKLICQAIPPKKEDKIKKWIMEYSVEALEFLQELQKVYELFPRKGSRIVLHGDTNIKG